MNYVELTDQAVESMRDRDPDEPVAMINLLKFRDVADPNLGLEMTSGRDCYFGHYIAGVPPIANRPRPDTPLSQRGPPLLRLDRRRLGLPLVPSIDHDGLLSK